MNNDKLKGEFYRTPMTKLASRSNVITQINELIEYYNSLSDLIDNTFDLITSDRERMKNILTQINNKTLHFKYILENFEPEITQHTEEKVASLMGTLSTNLNDIVTEYGKNLFNHAKQTDSSIKDDATSLDTPEEWDRSINHTASSLGIRWFGGKLTDKFFINQFNSVLHLVKVNNTDKYNIEDSIGSNIILEIFIFTTHGMSWLTLGQDGNFGYNIITKFQSKTNNIDMKIVSKNYFTPKSYDINKFDLECIIDTLLTQDDISSNNVYINIKTNIPANSYAGRESYYISKSSTFTDITDKKSIVNASNKLLYHDNKDIAYRKQETNSIDDVYDSEVDDIETNYVINPKSKKSSLTSSNSDNITKYYSEITTQVSDDSVSLSIVDKNGNNSTMINNSEKINGRVIHPKSYVAIDKSYLSNIDISSREYSDSGDAPVYNSGEQIEDLFDYRSVGKAQPILQNESMFEVDGAIGSDTNVVSSDVIYGESKNDITLTNKLYNNGSFDAVSSKENSFHVLEKHYDSAFDNTINEIKSTSAGVLAATNMGIYNFTKNAGIMTGTSGIQFTCIYESTSGIIYAGTGINSNLGIYYYDSDNKQWLKTNIQTGAFSAFVEDSMGYIFAFAENGGSASNKPETDVTTSTYKTTRTIFRGKNTSSFYAFEDMLNYGVYDSNNNAVEVSSFNSNCYKWTNYDEAVYFIQQSTSKNRKVFFNYAENKWYVFNPASHKLFISVDEYCYKFQIHPIHKNYKNVDDVLYTDDSLYISVTDNNNKSYVLNYKDNIERKIKIIDTIIKNNREIVKKNVTLTTLSDLNELGE